ncbi:unnamed protein product [Ectocarpus sp. 13 AM-2016]
MRLYLVILCPQLRHAVHLTCAQVGRVVMLWTAARVVWGLSTLTAVLEFQRLVGSATSLREQVYSILVVTLFLTTELYPLLAALDDELLLALSGAEDAAPKVGGGGTGGRNPGSGGSAIETARSGDQGRRSRTSRQLITASTTAVSALSGAGENNPMQPLLPRGGRRRDSWLSASSESELG